MVLADWLDQHTSKAPAALRARVREHADSAGVTVSLPAALTEAKRHALDRVLDHPGDRSVALDLLAADALVTLALWPRRRPLRSASASLPECPPRGFPAAVIDLHFHLLPGVDDGSRSTAKSINVLREMAKAGVTDIWLTPQMRAADVEAGPRAKHERAFEELKAVAPELPRLHRGAEVMLDRPWKGSQRNPPGHAGWLSIHPRRVPPAGRTRGGKQRPGPDQGRGARGCGRAPRALQLLHAERRAAVAPERGAYAARCDHVVPLVCPRRAIA